MIMCGIIGDKDDSMISQNFKKCDVNTLCMLKEERMFKMISIDFLHNSKNFYEYYKNFFTNVTLFSLSKTIEDEIFEDLAKFLQKFN